MNKEGIIIGAGIAGPAMAMRLKQAGINTVIFEAREQAYMEEGLFLGISPNGLNALDEIIDITQLRAHYTPGSIAFYNAKNKLIGQLDNRYQHRRYGAESIQIKRADLSRLLRQQSEALGIPIYYGHRLSDLEQSSSTVRAVFDNGKKISGDFLIACDGVHSPCRNNIFPEAPRPLFTKQLSTGSIISCAGINSDFGSINMVFGKRGFFGYAVSNQNQIWWFNNIYCEKEPARGTLSTTLLKDIKSRLLRIHKEDPPPITKIIEQSDDIFTYPVYEMPPLERWHTDRICLIGDAAHATAPHIGQGASLALEDTVVLARCLLKYDTYPSAFKVFQSLRQERVEKIVRQARKVGDAKSKPNPVATLFRDLFLRYFIKFEKKKMDWVYAYNASTVNISV